MFFRRQGRAFVSTENTQDLSTLRELAASGVITPVIDRVFPLDDGVAAVSFVGAGHNRGTTVIAL